MAKKRIAALAWPFLHKPAFALVVEVEWDLEDWKAEDREVKYTAKVIREAEEMSLPDMFRRCRELQKEYDIELWHGDAMNEPMISLMVQSGGAIPLTVAPYLNKPDASTLYLQAIRELTRKDKKVLSYGGSSLPGHVHNLPKDKPINISEYPPVAALGYASAALYLWLQLEYETKPKTMPQRIIERAEMTYADLLDRFEGYGGSDEDEEGFFPE